MKQTIHIAGIDKYEMRIKSFWETPSM